MPATETVVSHWRSVLGVTASNPQDIFFEMGGDSLLAIELIERIEKDLQVELPVDVLFIDGSLAALTQAAEQATTK